MLVIRKFVDERFTALLVARSKITVKALINKQYQINTVKTTKSLNGVLKFIRIPKLVNSKLLRLCKLY
jgi:hypothetical protein